MFTGSCLCGGVRFRVEAEPEPIQVCYCQQCRKAQGAALVTNMPVPEAAFHLLGGADLLKAFESSPGKNRVFCSRCGSPIYSKTDRKPGVVRIRAGLVDGPLRVKPAAHFHVASKPGWWEITDDLPQFEEGYVQRTDHAQRSRPEAPSLLPLPELRRGRYRHYKGGEYEVVGVARHSETLEPMVVYRPLYKASGWWVRPYVMFTGEVVIEGVKRPRFAFVEPTSA